MTTDSALEAALKAYETAKANRDRMKGKTEEYAELSQWVEATTEQIATSEALIPLLQAAHADALARAQVAEEALATADNALNVLASPFDADVYLSLLPLSDGRSALVSLAVLKLHEALGHTIQPYCLSAGVIHEGYGSAEAASAIPPTDDAAAGEG